MYKKLVTAGLITASSAALSGPYLGIGYEAGATRVEQDSLRNPVVDGRTLDQSDHEYAGGARLLAGFQFSDRWALELTAGRPSLETGIEERIAGTGDDEEWESSVDATHVTLAPVYLHRLSPRTELRFTAGLLVGDYDIRRSHGIDVDNGADQVLARTSASESKLGATIGAGAAFQTPWKFEVLGEVLHQRTRVLAHSAVAVSVLYRF